jgi:hypothetical protein
MTQDRMPLWRREGLLVPVKTGHPWWRTHAQLPTILPLSDRLWRVYFAARDGDNRSAILAVDLDPADDMRILAEHFEPVLGRGPAGAFDHEGVGPASAIVVDGEIRLYYGGLIVRQDVSGQVGIGLAVSADGLSFRRAFAGPVHGIGPFDPYFTSAPTVLKTADGFRMWYVGGTQWRKVNDIPELFYEIRTTRSADGMIWDPRSETAVALQPPAVAGLGRPWITEGGRRLWLSRRGEAYRAPGEGAYHLVSIAADDQGSFVGPAVPLRFENPPGADDFDSWMQAYTCVVPYRDDLMMVYNGNDFGRAGFGWARMRGGARVN